MVKKTKQLVEVLGDIECDKSAEAYSCKARVK